MENSSDKSKFRLIDYFWILLGTCLTGFAAACFITPAKIAGGGVTGISTILYYLLGFDPGLTVLVLSVPLFFLAWKMNGKRYALNCLLGSVLYSLWVSFFGHVIGYQGILSYTDRVDVLLSVIYGGVFYGVGIGIVMRAGANTGGTDIIAQIISKKTPLTTGTALFIVDGLIIIAGAVFFGYERAFFAVLTLFLSTESLNYVVVSMGTRFAKTVYIVTQKSGEISKRIVHELHHGATLIQGKGVYTGEERNILMAVVHNRQLSALQRIVREEDSGSFMFINETYTVAGQGFGNIPIKEVKERADYR